jgi:lycopene cyclase domain-containing protein
MSTYLAINLIILAFPLLASFEKRIAFFKKLPAVLVSIIFVGIPFILWDAVFTSMGVWAFSQEHLLGAKLLGLPIEEILFFVTVPYSCLFVFEAIQYFFKDTKIKINAKLVAGVSLVLALAGLFVAEKTYTSIILLVAAFMLVSLKAFVPWLLESSNYWKFITITFGLFLVFNYFLTAIPIVTYGAFANSGIRVLTIPIEDFFYNFCMLSANLAVYLIAKKKLGI